MQKSPKAKSRDALYSLLGDLPDRDRPISAKLVRIEDRPGYVLETLLLDLNGVEEVPAYFTRPRDSKGGNPTVIFNHSHGGNYSLGKDEFLNGCPYLHNKPYADELSVKGINGFCIDHWCFGQRRGRSESATFKEMLWNGRVLWGMMLYDSIRSLDYLASRNDVDMDKIATIGISMGSTMAWWLAALDERVKVCVDICCLTDFHALIKSKGLDHHGIYYYVPNLLRHFSASDINALIAPRAHLSLAGIYDVLTPPEGLDIIDSNMKKAYEEAGAPENWRLSRYGCGHVETAAMRKEILDFLDEKLC